MLFPIRQRQQMLKQSHARSEDTEFSDIEIVDRLLHGVPAERRRAFDLFYQRYKRLIYHCIRTRAHAADVDDIFQSFFERLMKTDYRVLWLWQRESSLPIYLSKVMRNFVVDFHRKRHRRDKWETPEGELPEPPEPLEEETLTTAIILKQLRGIGLRVWAKLDSRDRQLICWKFHRDLTNEAMAERLKLTSGALRTALSRAVERWLRNLKGSAPEYFPE